MSQRESRNTNSSPLMKNALDPRFRGDERRKKEHRDRGDERNKSPPATQHTAHCRASGNPGIQNSSPLMKNALDPRFRGDERRKKEHRFRGDERRKRAPLSRGRAVDSI